MTEPVRSERQGRPYGADLLGVAEVAKRLGVKANTVVIWRRRHQSFPEPITQLSTGPVWWAPDVDTWAEETGRKP